MLFNSLSFLLFFPIVTVLYFIIPHQFRWFLLLISSCVFYMAFIPGYILVLLLTILIDYFAGIYIEKSEDGKKKKYLIASILSTCFVLFAFKYYNFFGNNLNVIAHLLHWNYQVKYLLIILPIGLSFHTFQSLSYVIEVYKGRQKAERNFGIYALYVMFYPQLVAGPIERPQNMIHQFYEKHNFEYQRVTDGLKLMAWGFFKKVVVADNLAITVNGIYNNVHLFHGFPLVVATILFAIEIYCDFSGYSDIAIGSAQVMGFRLMNNFNHPYFSKSISEFWSRWHISLSSWFRDYIYIPLGGNRVGRLRHYFNIFVTFLASGFWHGANWTFIIWGILHGIFTIFGVATKGIRQRGVNAARINRIPTIHKLITLIINFILVTFAWIFFRANSVSDAFYVIKNMFIGLDSKSLNTLRIILTQNVRMDVMAYLLVILFTVELLQRKVNIRKRLSNKPLLVRWVVYYFLIILIITFSASNLKQFIYFQF